MKTVKRALGHLITCKHATHLVSEMQERELGALDRLLLRLHLAWCKACEHFERQLRFLHEAMGKYRE
jgi:hypothetical protein